MKTTMVTCFCRIEAFGVNTQLFFLMLIGWKWSSLAANHIFLEWTIAPPKSVEGT